MRDKYLTMLMNKYYNWYNDIIKNALYESRTKGEGIYYESHHIIPKALGGPDDKENLVLLTAKEHLVCHHLLTKFTKGTDKSKMVYAYWSLINGWGNHRKRTKITARQYETIKEQVAKQISINNRGRPGRQPSPEHREILRQRMLGDNNPMRKGVPWNKGIKSPGVGGRTKGYKWSDAERKAHLAARAKPGHYDYLKDPERCKKISESQKGRPGTSTGTIWCNDGKKEYQVTELPEGFKRGRLITNASKKGMRWFNDGKNNRQFREGTQPMGYTHGRISKK